MNLSQNYMLLQIIEKVLDNCSRYDEHFYCTDENLLISFSQDEKDELEKIKKTLVSKCKSLL